MRKSHFALLLLVVCTLAACGGGGDGTAPPDGTGTGFGSALNITNNAGSSHLSSTAISGTGATATVLVAWRDDVGGTFQIYLARSTDGGATFGAPINLSNSATGYIAPSARPSVAIAGTGATATVLVAWHGQTTNYEIFMVRSTDGGATFGAPVNMSNNTGSSAWPSVAISGTGSTATVLLAWEGQPGNITGQFSDILLRRSTNGGASFAALINLSNKVDGGTSVNYPSVAISGTGITGTAVVAWQDNSAGNFEIYRATSTNTGANFSAPVNHSNNAQYSALPSVTIAGETLPATVVIAWQQSDPAGSDRVFVSRSIDGGATYGAGVNLGTNDGEPSVAISGTGATATVLLAWEDNADIYLKRSTDGGATFGSVKRLSNNSGFTVDPALAISGTGATETAVVVWSDDVTAGKDIFRVRSQ